MIQEEPDRSSKHENRIAWTFSFVFICGASLILVQQYRLSQVQSPIGARKRKRTKPLCNRTQVQHGQWIQEILPQEPYKTNYVLTCRPTTIITNNTRRKVFIDYRWQTNDHETCEFAEWNARLFCQLTQNAPILILGDSLSWEMYLALVEQYVISSSKFQFRSFEKPTIQAICDGGTYVAFRRTDLLQSIDATISEDFFPAILILNRGAHYVPDDQLLRELNVTFHHVQEWLRMCRQVHGIRCHFYWRTTVPGHADCRNFSEPVNNLTFMEEYVTTHDSIGQTKNGPEDFHWRDFQHQNELVLELLQSMFPKPEGQDWVPYRILDAYYLNILRPDRHAGGSDCLHSCAPGKVSVYNRLLLHWLRMDRTLQDIRQAVQYAKTNSSWMNRSETPLPT